MRIKTLIGSALLAVGLLTGCGGAEADVEQEAMLATQEEAIALPNCTTQYWVDFYSDARKTNLVGQRVCRCGSPMAFWGNIRAPYTEDRLPYAVCQ